MTVTRTRCLTAAAATMLAVLWTSPGSAQVARFDHAISFENQALSNVRWYGYRGGYRGGWRGYGWRGGYRGAAIGAGIAGLAIGGAIASQAAPYYYGGGYYPGYYYGPAPGYYYGTAPGYSYSGGTAVADSDAYCRRHYRSYDPTSRTYLNNDGRRYPCP
jgi:hypothetical protein